VPKSFNPGLRKSYESLKGESESRTVEGMHDSVTPRKTLGGGYETSQSVGGMTYNSRGSSYKLRESTGRESESVTT
jgi:hypothetical protein